MNMQLGGFLSRALSKKELKLLVTFFIIYAFFVQWYGWNEESRFALTRAMVDEGRLQIDSYYNQTGDRATYNGHYYSDKEPGASFLSVPVYAAWKLFYSIFSNSFGGSREVVTQVINGVRIASIVNPGFFVLTAMLLIAFFISPLLSAFTVLLVYKISRYFTANESYRLLLAAVYGLGTLAFPNALLFMGQSPAAFFGFIAFYLLFKIKNDYSAKDKEKNKNLVLVVAGILMGLSIITEYSTLLIGLVLIYYSFFADRKKYPLFIVGLVIGLLPLLAYNYAIFGTPFELTRAHVDHSLYPLAYTVNNSVNPATSTRTDQINLLGPLEGIIRYLQFEPRVDPYVLLRMMFYPYRGIFFYYPILLLSVIGLYYMYKKFKIESIVIAAVFVLFMLALSSRVNWWGNYSFGNRHLMPIMPFFVLPMIFVFDKIDKKILALLVVFCITINFIGLQPAEDIVTDPKTLQMKEEYASKQDTFEILYNPISSYYLPLTLQYGPRSRIFESLINGYTDIDIRVNPISKGANFPFTAFHVPFLCLLPLVVLIAVVWWGSLFNYLKALGKIRIGVRRK